MLTASSQSLLLFRLLKWCLHMQLTGKCHTANGPHTWEFSKDRKNTYAAVVSLMHKPSRTLWEKESVCASWTDLTWLWVLMPSSPARHSIYNKNVQFIPLRQLVMNKSVWLQTVNLGVWQIPKAGKIISMFWSIKPFPHSLKHIHQPPGLNQYHQHSRLHQNSAFSCWEIYSVLQPCSIKMLQCSLYF